VRCGVGHLENIEGPLAQHEYLPAAALGGRGRGGPVGVLPTAGAGPSISMRIGPCEAALLDLSAALCSMNDVIRSASESVCHTQQMLTQTHHTVSQLVTFINIYSLPYSNLPSITISPPKLMLHSTRALLMGVSPKALIPLPLPSFPSPLLLLTDSLFEAPTSA
jgi:hypothetical protein